MSKRVSCASVTGDLHGWISICLSVVWEDQAIYNVEYCLGNIDSRFSGDQAGFDTDGYGNRGVWFGCCGYLSDYGWSTTYDYVETYQDFVTSKAY